MTNRQPMLTNQLIIEGPDLSGKSTLCSKIHKDTGFKWNIQDRSALSMLCYARQFDRDTSVERIRLDQELNNLNNRVIILLPDFDVIEKRYHQRGDEVQSLESLKYLYKIFKEESEKIRHRPNVIFLDVEEDADDLVMCIEEWMYSLESCRLEDLGDVVKDTLHGIAEDEAILQARVMYEILPVDDQILENPLEGEYYTEILGKIYKIIEDEKAGNNEYNAPQGIMSRRFYYNSSTCISSIHFLPRNESLNTLVTFRSLDVDKNARIDLKFIEYLVFKINQKFGFECKNADVRIAFNNAHIRKDLVN